MNRPKLNDKDYSLLFDACNIGNIKLIRAICDYDNINHQDAKGYTLLSVACMRNDILMIKSLLKFIPDVNIKTKDGFSPLMFCIKNNNLKAVKLLVENGANINEQKKIGSSLMYACSYGFFDIVEFLINSGSKINICDGEKNTLLMISSKEGNYKLVKYLIEKGIDIFSINKYGNNSLMFSIINNNIDVMRLLIEKGIDINSYNKEGTTALMLAIQYKRYHIMDELLSNSEIDVNMIDFDGYTALMYCCLIQDIQSIAFLLNNKKTNINKTNHENETALMIAIRKDNEDLTSLLLSKMADSKIKNIKGENAFKIAAINGNFSIAKMILDYSSVNIDLYDKSLIDSYKKNILKLEREIIDKEKINSNINLYLDNENILQQFEKPINETYVNNNIELIEEEVIKISLVPNDVILKRDTKELINLNIKDVDSILGIQTIEENTTIEKNLREEDKGSSLNLLNTKEIDSQREIIEVIDKSIKDLSIKVNDYDRQQLEFNQKWLNLNVDRQKSILNDDSLTIIEKMEKWIEFVQQSKVEWSPKNRFKNKNDLIIIDNNNMKIDEKKYQEKIFTYWEKLQKNKEV